MNYCGDCEHRPSCDNRVTHTVDDFYCRTADLVIGLNHPACRKFSVKKRICGECVHPYWRGDGNGLCTIFQGVYPHYKVTKKLSACDNFKE